MLHLRLTGFGADGSHDEMKQDFEQVRGDFESNTFVTAVLKHIEDKTALGNELIKRIEADVYKRQVLYTPSESASSSEYPVHTCCPFSPWIIAVPVS